MATVLVMGAARECGGEHQLHNWHHGGGPGAAGLTQSHSHEGWRGSEAQFASFLREIVWKDRMTPAAWPTLHFDDSKDHGLYWRTPLERRDGLSSGSVAFDPTPTKQSADDHGNVNLIKKNDLLQTDSYLISVPESQSYVQLYAPNDHRFLLDFVPSAEKVGLVSVTTGTEGAIRRVCQRFNT